MPPHFEKFTLETLNSEQKPSVKTGRPGGQPARRVARNSQWGLFGGSGGGAPSA